MTYILAQTSWVFKATAQPPPLVRSPCSEPHRTTALLRAQGGLSLGSDTVFLGGRVSVTMTAEQKGGQV